jgi:hypothetical protein
MTRTLLCGCVRMSVALIAMWANIAEAARPEPPFTNDPYPSTYQPPPRVDTLIVDVTILDGAGKRIENGEILLREGKIVAIGHGLARENVTTVQGRGRWVTPGIIDVHCHNGTYVLPLTSLSDLVLWSGDPFSIYTRAYQVFIDGALVYDRAAPDRLPGADFGLGRPEMGGRQ